MEANHGMRLDTSSLSHNWSGLHPSKLSGTTAFNVVGKVTVPVYNENTSCSHGDTQRLLRIPRHRGNTKLEFKIKFTANTEDGQPVEAVLPLKQDDIDQVRQEYVDIGNVIPERVDPKWTGQDTYDFGHYRIMLNIGLSSKHSQWVAQINNRKSAKVDAFAVSDFVLTSGYRNPHHNFHHTPSTAKLSPHMYGYALDVRGKLDAQDQTLDINGDEKNTAADRTVMANAAKATGSREPIIYSGTLHVHVDWAPSNWASRKKTPGPAPSFSLPPQSTDAPLVVAPPNNQPPPTNSPPTGSGCANNPTYNYCTDTGSCTTRSPSGVPGECGHNYCCCAPSGSPMSPGDTPGSSNPGSTPPAPSTVSCVRGVCRIAVSTPGEHRVQCDAGHTYMSCNTGSSNLHRTRTCRRSACRQTWQRCTSRAPSCLAYSGRSCWAE